MIFINFKYFFLSCLYTPNYMYIRLLEVVSQLIDDLLIFQSFNILYTFHFAEFYTPMMTNYPTDDLFST